MYDDDQERQRVVALFQRYNRERLSPEVDAGFRRLAHERMRRAPLRTFVLRPLQRMLHMWAPVDEGELPMRVAWLGLPKLRWLFGVWNACEYALALVGVAALWRRRQRALLAVLLSAVAVRSILCSYLVPLGLTERLLVEAVPILLILAIVGAVALAQAARRWRPFARTRSAIV
jgi:hypothetical protein